MPNKKAIRLWVEDLRTTETPQAHNHLRDDERFCCLGVACNTFHRATGTGSWRLDDEGEWWFFDGASDGHGVLPHAVRAWLDLNDNPYVKIANGETDFCAVLNDTGWSFAEIADAIERTYLTPDVP